MHICKHFATVLGCLFIYSDTQAKNLEVPDCWRKKEGACRVPALSTSALERSEIMILFSFVLSITVFCNYASQVVLSPSIIGLLPTLVWSAPTSYAHPWYSYYCWLAHFFTKYIIFENKPVFYYVQCLLRVLLKLISTAKL